MTEDIDKYLETRQLYGRYYQAFSIEKKKYLLPIDAEEESRQELEDEILFELYGERLFLPSPLPVPTLRAVLDAGAGMMGCWAKQVADQYPNCSVYGIDIFPNNEHFDSDYGNLQLIHADLNKPLNRQLPALRYDFIHSRCVGLGIKATRWQPYVKGLADLLQRGGWLQLIEYDILFQSDNGTLPGNGWIRSYWERNVRTWLENELKIDCRVGPRLAQMLIGAGLSQVRTENKRLPIGSWPEDPQERELGIKNLKNMQDLLESVGLYPLSTNWMSEDSARQAIEGARSELGYAGYKLYIQVYAAYGKKD